MKKSKLLGNLPGKIESFLIRIHDPLDFKPDLRRWDQPQEKNRSALSQIIANGSYVRVGSTLIAPEDNQYSRFRLYYYIPTVDPTMSCTMPKKCAAVVQCLDSPILIFRAKPNARL